MKLFTREWADLKHILCVRLDNIGDVLMCSPAIRALKSASPQRRVTLLTSAHAADAASLIPDIDGLIAYDAPWVKITAPRNSADIDRRMIEFIQSLQCDGAVIFTSYSQSPLPAALLCYLAGIRNRAAYCHENPYQLLTHWLPDPEPGNRDSSVDISRIRHEVQRQIDLAAELGAVSPDHRIVCSPRNSDQHYVETLLQERGIGNRFIVVHPGATALSRRYPPEMFGQAIDLLPSSHDILLTGSPSEENLISVVRRNARRETHSMVGHLTLTQLAALIEKADLLISNNTAPVHIASGVETPVVCLYALTNPQHTPWKVESEILYHDVPCRFCYKSVCPQGHHHCLKLVKPEDVAAAARRLLSAAEADFNNMTKDKAKPCTL